MKTTNDTFRHKIDNNIEWLISFKFFLIFFFAEMFFIVFSRWLMNIIER